jgi:hypothetical protein
MALRVLASFIEGTQTSDAEAHASQVERVIWFALIAADVTARIGVAARPLY